MTGLWKSPQNYTGTPAQWWQAIAEGNDLADPPVPLGTDERYLADNRKPSDPCSKLLTGNRFFEEPMAPISVGVSYSVEPDLTFHDDPCRQKLFDGGRKIDYWTVAWLEPTAGVPITTTLTLGESNRWELLKIYISAGEVLPRFQNSGGMLSTYVSGDGELWNLAGAETIEASTKLRENFVYESFSGEYKYVKIEFVPTVVPVLGVFQISEVAVWGKEAPLACGDWGYRKTDFNEDCYVNLLDLSVLSTEWLRCTQPDEPGCEHAP